MRTVDQRWFSRNPRLIRRIVRCLVLGLLLLKSDSIQASCGDYLHAPVQKLEIRDRRELTSLPVPSGVDFHQESAPVRPDSPVPHCSGPFCQQSPFFPTDPHPPVHRLVVKEMCLVNETGIATPESWCPLDRSSELTLDEPELLRRDRPPQG